MYLVEAVSQPCYLRRVVKEEVIMVWSHPLDLLDFQLLCVAPGDLVECNLGVLRGSFTTK